MKKMRIVPVITAGCIYSLGVVFPTVDVRRNDPGGESAPGPDGVRYNQCGWFGMCRGTRVNNFHET